MGLRQVREVRQSETMKTINNEQKAFPNLKLKLFHNTRPDEEGVFK